MKSLFFLLTFVLSTSIFSKDVVDLDLKLSINDKLITSGRVITFEDEEVTLEKINSENISESKINVLARKKRMNGKNGFLVKLNIMHSKEKNIFVKEQEVFVLENQLAEFEVRNNNSKDKLKLTMLVKKTN